MIGLETLLVCLFVSFGVTYVITGSEIGFPVRCFVCWALKWSAVTRYFWALVRCPPCNAWWTGFFAGLYATSSIVQALQVAFGSCGLMALIQAILGGNGIAAGENFKEAFGLTEEDHGTGSSEG